MAEEGTEYVPPRTISTGIGTNVTDPTPSPQPTPEDEPRPAASRDVEFPCDRCGAEMRWNPDVDAMLCKYCGNQVEVARDQEVILERPLEEAGEAARGLGLEVRVAHCDTCGARVTYNEAATTETCVYCGSPSVLAQEANRNAIRPESLVPLDVGRAEVEQNFKRWIRRLWFRPNELKRMKRFNAVGVYVPFWTFDCFVHSAWRRCSASSTWASAFALSSPPVMPTR